MTEERLLTARQFAQRLGVSTGALLRWTRAGKVPPAVKLPSGAIRYVPELIDPWLATLAVGADGAAAWIEEGPPDATVRTPVPPPRSPP